MENQRNWLNIGEFQFSQAQVIEACHMFGDTNPMHLKKGVVQFGMTLGSVGARAYQWCLDNGLIKRLAVIKEYTGKCGETPIRASYTYDCQADFDPGDGKIGTVYFRIVDLSKKEHDCAFFLFEGTLTVRYNSPN